MVSTGILSQASGLHKGVPRCVFSPMSSKLHLPREGRPACNRGIEELGPAQNPSALQSLCPRLPLAVPNTYFFTSPHTQPLTSDVHGGRLRPAPPCSQFPSTSATAGRRRVPPAISDASTRYNTSRGLGGACCQAARDGRL